MKIIQLPFIGELQQALLEKEPLIQVVIGPRQIGKTTGIELLLSKQKKGSCLYVSADGDVQRPASWLVEQWEIAKAKNQTMLLVIDEIQKVENWSEKIKQLWDEQKRTSERLKLILLGSSSLSIQRGLSESLAGRYQLHKVFHWSPVESQKAYNLSFNDYIIFGGYPGSYRFSNQKDRWLKYLRDSIVNPVIGKDILSQAHVKSPALFRQCFDLICSYAAQEISYTKLLGQLQDKGNTDLVKYYLELFEGAFLIKQLFKFFNKKHLSRSSSPKILPLCPALYTITLDADLNNMERGRAFEVAIGAHLVRLPGQLYYWREGAYEVDFVYAYGKKTIAIEVKSGQKKQAKGLERFKQKFPNSSLMVITPDNYISALKKL